MKFLHAMIRVRDLEKSLDFYQKLLGLKLTRTLRLDDATLYYLANKEGEPEIELTHNDEVSDDYEVGEAFGHFAFETDSMEEFSKKMSELGYKYVYEPFELKGMNIAFLNDPDGNAIEIIEKH